MYKTSVYTLVNNTLTVRQCDGNERSHLVMTIAVF